MSKLYALARETSGREKGGVERSGAAEAHRGIKEEHKEEGEKRGRLLDVERYRCLLVLLEIMMSSSHWLRKALPIPLLKTAMSSSIPNIATGLSVSTIKHPLECI
ncbi:Protein of unknown function [Pyronema omphalodes CBS 100304]|uniref:Uncharacterized protein n=1 Tax=Pyronema omphalodes (strain CBS 100304) TaxID=1076935 RepID=U4L761_PYROM|nr:Protein of unknown function [Pyronema omphalodes CBS 100304]